MQQQQHIPSYISYTTSPSKRIKMHFITSKLGSIEGLCGHRFWSSEPGNDPAWISELEKQHLHFSNFQLLPHPKGIPISCLQNSGQATTNSIIIPLFSTHPIPSFSAVARTNATCSRCVYSVRSLLPCC